MTETPTHLDELVKLLAGRQLKGSWRLDAQPLRKGRSGQALLFGGRDERTDERVVIKVFRLDRAADFRNETSALRRLTESPGARTVPFRDSGEIAEGGLRLLFVVMGFAEGVSLDALLTSPLLSRDERLEILTQIADGLAELHRCGVIHRDLKPGNIIVRFIDVDSLRPSDYLGVRLVDFGISTVLAPAAERHITSSVTGTLPYMAPEQRAERPELSLATDLYGFALIARDLLCGEERLQSIEAAQARLDIEKALGGMARARPLRDLFATCLAQRPEERLKDGVELSVRLRPLVLRDDPPPTYPRARALREWRRRLLNGDIVCELQPALTLLHEFTLRLCSSIILACLTDEARNEASARLLRGEDLRLLVEEMRRREDLGHPAGRAAISLLTLRYDSDGVLVGPEGDLRPDSTLEPGTLLDNVRQALQSGDAARMADWLRRLYEALLREPLLEEFTLARIDTATGGAPGHGGQQKQLIVSHAEERRYPWPMLVGDGLSSREPLLVKVSTLGRPDLEVMPVRLSPFALLAPPDHTGLLFLSGGTQGKQLFRSPFSGEAVPAPANWAAPAVPSREPPAPPPSRGRIHPSETSVRLPCRGRPLRELCSPRGVFLLTDANEWLAYGPDLSSYPTPPLLPPCSGFAADPEGNLVVGHYDGMVARLQSGDWEYYSHETAILAVAATQRGVVLGDDMGAILILTEGLEHTGIALGEPIIELSAVRGFGLAALLASGRVSTVRWPDETVTQELLLPPELGRPRSFFSFAGGALLGLCGTDRIGLCDLATFSVRLTGPLSGGIRAVSPAVRDVIWVLFDGGEVQVLELSTMKLRPVRLPHSEHPVVGVRPHGERGALLFTAAGELFSVGKDRAVRRFSADGVALAFAAPELSPQLALVRWQAGEGVLLSLETRR